MHHPNQLKTILALILLTATVHAQTTTPHPRGIMELRLESNQAEQAFVGVYTWLTPTDELCDCTKCGLPGPILFKGSVDGFLLWCVEVDTLAQSFWIISPTPFEIPMPCPPDPQTFAKAKGKSAVKPFVLPPGARIVKAPVTPLTALSAPVAFNTRKPAQTRPVTAAIKSKIAAAPKPPSPVAPAKKFKSVDVRKGAEHLIRVKTNRPAVQAASKL